jgi:PRTRC genetic system protein E
MFTELLPIVRNRKVTIIIKHDADDTLTVNVVPIQLRADENPALCTPLSDVGVTGTAAELDRDFPQALTGYVAQHLTLAQALNQSAAEMEAAKKSAADAAKQASKDASEKWKKTKSGGPQAPAKPTPAAPPAPPSLFDAAPTESTPGAPGLFNTPQPETASATSTATDSEPEGSEDEEDSETDGADEEDLACAV